VVTPLIHVFNLAAAQATAFNLAAGQAASLYLAAVGTNFNLGAGP
jgi:hypothetical protein